VSFRLREAVYCLLWARAKLSAEFVTFTQVCIRTALSEFPCVNLSRYKFLSTVSQSSWSSIASGFPTVDEGMLDNNQYVSFLWLLQSFCVHSNSAR